MEQQLGIIESYQQEFGLEQAQLEFDSVIPSEDRESFNNFLKEKGIANNDDAEYLIFVCTDTSEFKNFQGYTLIKNDSSVYLYKKEGEESSEMKRKREEEAAEKEEKKRKLNDESQTEEKETPQTDLQNEIPEQSEVTKAVDEGRGDEVEGKDVVKEAIEKTRTAEVGGESRKTKEDEEKVLQDQ